MSLNVTMIRNSFAIVKPNAEKFLTYFYQYMFNNFPTSRKLFQEVDMVKQKKSLAAALVFLIDNLENSGKIEDTLTKMGERHIKYGVEEAHYEFVGKSLLATFAFFLEDQWTPELQKEWIKLYGIISETMIKGARQAQGTHSQPDNTSSPSATGLQAMIREEIKVLIRDIYSQEISGLKPQIQHDVKSIVSEIVKTEVLNAFSEPTASINDIKSQIKKTRMAS